MDGRMDGRLTGDACEAPSETSTVDVPRTADFPAPLPRFELVGGTFLSDGGEPMVSSARKQVLRGTFVRRDGVRLPAVAAIFAGGDPAFYASEVASLSRSRLLCVGPEVYELVGSVALSGAPVPVIVEEDAGANLEEAVFSGAPLVGPDGEAAAPLAPVGTRDREFECDKILYDVLDQVEILHRHGLYHRDVRAANICVRRFGPRPQDVHATLIDHELVTSYEGCDVPASARRYGQALFEGLPRSVRTGASPVRPTSLMRDAGYLAALRYELATGRGVEHARPEDLAFGRRPFFQYAASGLPVVRRLDREQDLEPLARRLGLESVEEATGGDARLSAYVRQHVAPGGYLDERARRIVERDAALLREIPVEGLARDAAYRTWVEECRRAGREPEYASFDDQPETLRASNEDQVRDIPAKVRALGYRIVPISDAPAASRVAEFSPEEVEALAFLEHRRWWNERLRAGWVAGPVRDDERRVHPDMVPYDDLSEQSREYDRAAVRAIPGILERAGLAVVR